MVQIKQCNSLEETNAFCLKLGKDGLKVKTIKILAVTDQPVPYNQEAPNVMKDRIVYFIIYEA